MINELYHKKTGFLPNCTAFVFAVQIVKSFYDLYPKQDCDGTGCFMSDLDRKS